MKNALAFIDQQTQILESLHHGLNVHSLHGGSDWISWPSRRGHICFSWHLRWAIIVDVAVSYFGGMENFVLFSLIYLDLGITDCRTTLGDSKHNKTRLKHNTK